jgi:acyl carrier protein
VNADEIKRDVKQFIMKEFLPGENPDELSESTPLITGGILDSIATLKLVMFMEERFGVTLQAHETDPDYLDTIDLIGRTVLAKKAGG